jgi:hypothetical protein
MITIVVAIITKLITIFHTILTKLNIISTIAQTIKKITVLTAGHDGGRVAASTAVAIAADMPPLFATSPPHRRRPPIATASPTLTPPANGAEPGPLSVPRGRRGLDGGGGGHAAALRNVAATPPSSPHRHRFPDTHPPANGAKRKMSINA